MTKLFHRDQVELVLGSKSQRRRQFIQELKMPFKIAEIDCEEVFPDDLPVLEVPEYLARLKAKAFSGLKTNQILITADTDVILGNEILGKPANIEQAKQSLQQLSGKKHFVVSGICFSFLQDGIVHSHSFSEQTEVTFYPLSSQDIDYYVNNFEVLDKAGAYAIQDWIGKIGVKEIKGSYFNVIGLPLSRIHQELQQFIQF